MTKRKGSPPPQPPQATGALAEALAAAADAPVAPALPREQESELLLVRAAERFYALPVQNVTEVVSADCVVTSVPHMPTYVRGVFNRHGRVSPVFDLGVYAGGEAEREPQRLVVLEALPLEAAVPVGQVLGMASVRASEVQPPLPASAPFVVGQILRDDRLFALVDVAGLLAGGRTKDQDDP